MEPDPRPDWMRRCPPEMPLTDEEAAGLVRILLGTMAVTALALVGLGWLILRRWPIS